MRDIRQLEALALSLGLVTDSLYHAGSHTLKVRSPYQRPDYNAHGLHYQSWNDRFSTSNGIQIWPDQVATFLAAYADEPNASPFLLLSRCGIDPFNNFRASEQH
ncbi:hypothetical protein [Kitasatospora aureofaciens]|uniref:hypothetical protein n=1 Tax=Kitasatospora aureofaciens TaxID=1894 RepID=UPI0033E8B516